jgi:hypothetical protein
MTQAESDDAEIEHDLAGVREWVSGWGREVAAVEMTTARARFEPGLIAFGTHADVVVGLDEVEAEQWTQVWPSIEDFRFRVELMKIVMSADRLTAVVAVPWDSTGFDERGVGFARPGRATIVVRRADGGAPWRGIHTHFSLARGVPPRTFGRPRSR